MHMAKKTRKDTAAKPAEKPHTEARQKAKDAPVREEVLTAEPATKTPETAPADEATMLDAPSTEPAQKAGGPREQGGLIKGLMVVGLLAAVLFMAYYFLTLSENSFVPGSVVDAETFKGIFSHAQNVFIVMDVRGVSDTAVSNNVLQCGVDFAASSGMGGKTVTPISLGNEGCVAPDGVRKPKECFTMLQDGVTIYVKEGPGGANYYSNGMVVFVGNQYALGTCGIKATAN